MRNRERKSERKDTGREIFREAKADTTWSTKLHIWTAGIISPDLEANLNLHPHNGLITW